MLSEKVKSERGYEKNMTYQNYIDSLKGELEEILDLDELEVNIYLNLLRTGPITASALAKELDVDRARMYRTVDRLVSKNILSTTLSIPKLCIPADPKDALKLALRKKEEEVRKIKNSGDEIIEKINSEIAVKNGITVPTFRVIQGRTNVYSDIAQIIERSTDIVYIVTTIEDISKMYHSNIPEKITISEKNGGEIRLIVEIDDFNLIPFVKRFNASEIKATKLPSKGRIVVQKNKQLIMSDSGRESQITPNSDLDFSLCTNSLEMVNNLNGFCEMLWKVGKPIETF